MIYFASLYPTVPVDGGDLAPLASAVRLAERVPVVHAVEPARVRSVSAREGLHRVDVVVVEVVVPDRDAHVVWRSVMGEVPRRGKDRVVRVHDVAALAVV